MKIALSPLNLILGDWEGNLKLHQERIAEAAKMGANLVVFPELSLPGYLPLDLLMRPSWVGNAEKQLDRFQSWLLKNYPDLAVVVGTTCAVEAQSALSRGLANCAVFLEGRRKEIRAKTLLPDYDVFHELRYFDSALSLDESFRAPIEFRGRKIGILICEDSWEESEVRGRRLYRHSPTEALAKQGCDLLLNLSASPFDRAKRERRRAGISESARRSRVNILYVNHFGGQDELLFDGDCFHLLPDGVFAAEKNEANDQILLVDLDGAPRGAPRLTDPELRFLEAMLVAGIRDYCRKNGFEKAVLGISGGIDSALVAALACRALGPKNLTGLILPSKFSSSHSIEDAEILAKNAGFEKRFVPIKMPHSTLQMMLQPFFQGIPEDITEENLQSRIRGLTVMAFANKTKALALATGNRSEFAMGYATLYGDMCGALAPIGDLLKNEVYELARYLNRDRPWIPERTFSKAPSAELKPNQTDQDTLPPYDLLDECLRVLLEKELEPDAALPLVREKFPQADLALLERVHKSIRLSEYKRRQAPPILKISSKAFGPGRVYPITCRF